MGEILEVDVGTVLVFLVVFLGLWLFLDSRFPDMFPPGPRPLPIIGNMVIMAKNPKQSHLILMDLSQKYGPVVGFKMGNYPAVILNDMDSLKECLVNRADAFSVRPRFMEVMNAIGSSPRGGQIKGVFWQNGKLLKDGRRFALSSMRDFGVGKKSIEGKIQEESVALCNELIKKAGKPHDVNILLQKSVTNIICNVLFGSRFEYSDQDFHQLLRMIEFNFESGAFTSVVNFIPILSFLPKRKWIHQVVSNTDKVCDWIRAKIEKRKETFDPADIKDFTELYLAKKKDEEEPNDVFWHLNMEKILVDLIFAGSETSKTALRWMLVYMLNYPEVQSRCHKEIDDMIGSRLPTLADRENMPFVEAVIHECLRLRPPVPLGVPHAADKDTTLYGYKIPKGTLVMTNLYSVQMDRKYWDKPEEFLPARWVGPDGRFQKKEGLAVFSIGPRSCLGEILAWSEMFLFFTCMLQKFEFHPVEAKNPPSLNGILGVTLSPEYFQIIAKPR